ncbi:16S rRNA (uracil(1498)-N(3))-methyltransferase [Planctomycetota bacterium]
MNRFFVGKTCFEGDRVRLIEGQAHQIYRVLRLQPDDRIKVLDNTGQEYEVVLQSVTARNVVGTILESYTAEGEPKTRVTLYQSILARDKFEWVLQKATEVGACKVVPVLTERSLVRDKRRFKPERLLRWQRIVTEAAEQSHRARIPEIAEPVPLSQALKTLPSYDRALIACPHRATEKLGTVLQDLPTSSSIALYIGPEGGFSKQEVDLVTQAGALPINLGPRILRTETAAIVAAAFILYEQGDFQSLP